MMGGNALLSVELRDARTKEEFKKRIQTYAQTLNQGQWILEGNWDHTLWGGELPNKEWIDSFTKEKPVAIYRLDGHMILANSAALKIADITKDTPDLPGGEIIRNSDGTPTGILKGSNMNVTSVHDVDSLGTYSAAKDLMESGELAIRIYLAKPLNRWNQDFNMNNENNKWLKTGLVKGFVDGSLGSHTAAFEEPYTDKPSDRGFFINTENELYSWAVEADKANLQVTVHAIATSATYINGNETIVFQTPLDTLQKKELRLKLNVIFEDDYLAIIAKPAGILVSGNSFKTIDNALIQNLKPSSQTDAVKPRPVHRLDYATTGLLLVGKTSASILALNKLFENKQITKTYLAVSIERFGYLNLVKLYPKTGRRHQLRKHLSATGNPILGDATYYKEGLLLKGKGMYLHAFSMEFSHPKTHELVYFEKAPALKYSRDVKVVVPKIKNNKNLWIWRARFWGHEPQTDIALLEKGFHLVYVDVAGLFGNKKAQRIWNKFYRRVKKKYKLNPKVVLEGFSRGGLIVYNWAAKNPEKVACIYADAPVCDIKSWPGGLYSGVGSPTDWSACLKAYGLDNTSVLDFEDIPINNGVKIAKANIPVIHGS
ncbi:Ribosomal large subunit pseudouridine synthase C [Nymphon striatum]|nr:Ribosomal large subunit pseudouridine synthase C [Nymphon striatum]KAG1649371.1 Ribosomal large subunit pseudouridine synthase C [Nymphon striatum]